MAYAYTLVSYGLGSYDDGNKNPAAGVGQYYQGGHDNLSVILSELDRCTHEVLAMPPQARRILGMGFRVHSINGGTYFNEVPTGGA